MNSLFKKKKLQINNCQAVKKKKPINRGEKEDIVSYASPLQFHGGVYGRIRRTHIMSIKFLVYTKKILKNVKKYLKHSFYDGMRA